MAAPFRLRTFGGLTLTSATGVVPASARRKRLALLALLAAARRRGMPRDKVIALLWPESDGERANSALYQLVYSIKRELGPAIVSAGADLSIDPSVLASDVDEFESALEARELERAVGCYAGSFLDGVFMRGAPDFERWVEHQRARLTDRFLAALESLAERAEQRRDLPAAITLWRRMAAAAPFHSTPVLRLMQALADINDMPSALQAARVHGAFVRAELDLPVDPRVEALASTLRERAVASPGVRQSERPAGVAETAGDAPRIERVEDQVNTVAPRPSRRRRSARLWLSATAALALTGILATYAHMSATPARGEWTVIAGTPAPIAAAAAGLVGSIDVIGGIGDRPGTMTAAAWAFDLARRRWTRLPPLEPVGGIPAPRSWRATTVASIASRIYLMGGNYPGFCTADARSFEPATQRWTRLAPMPTALCHAASVAAQGRVYVIGGTNTSGDVYNATVFVYDPATDHWRAAASPMPYAVTGAAAAVEGSTIYVMGGAISGGDCSRKVIAFETLTERWQVRDSLAVPRCEAGAAQLNGRIYAIGGLRMTGGANACSPAPCSRASALSSVESYDPETNAWRREADLPVRAVSAVAMTAERRIYVIGGYDDTGRGVPRVFEYHP